MSARPPTKGKARSFCYRASERLLPIYQVVAILQGSKFLASKTPLRRCVACDVRITNRNLGGYNGRSTLSGELWCTDCADLPPQRLLNLGGRQQ
jgi:hypothetical protein